MRNPITKAVRYFRREYPFTSVMGLSFTGIGVFVSTISTLATSGTSLAVIPAFTAVFAGLGTLFSLGSTGEMDRPDSNSVEVNGFKVVGDKRDVASVSMTQSLINDITKNQKHMAELPASKQRRIMNNIRDIEEKLARVRVYDSSGAQVSQFSFSRDMIDASGKEVKQNVATALVIKAEKQEAVVAPVVEAAPVAMVKPVASEFTTLSQKVEDVAKRVGQLENPQPEALDKPKLSAPTA